MSLGCTIFFRADGADEYGWLSGRYVAEFIVDGHVYKTVEQYIAGEKALLFNNFKVYEAVIRVGGSDANDNSNANEIANDNTNNKSQAEKRDRYHRRLKTLLSKLQVDDEMWAAAKREVKLFGTMEKFRQNPDLRDLLLSTGSVEIVKSDDLKAAGNEAYRVIMEARELLKKELS